MVTHLLKETFLFSCVILLILQDIVDDCRICQCIIFNGKNLRICPIKPLYSSPTFFIAFSITLIMALASKSNPDSPEMFFPTVKVLNFSFYIVASGVFFRVPHTKYIACHKSGSFCNFIDGCIVTQPFVNSL